MDLMDGLIQVNGMWPPEARSQVILREEYQDYIDWMRNSGFKWDYENFLGFSDDCETVTEDEFVEFNARIEEGELCRVCAMETQDWSRRPTLCSDCWDDEAAR